MSVVWLQRLSLRNWPMLALGAAAALGVALAHNLAGLGWWWAGMLAIGLLGGALARADVWRGAAAVLATVGAFALVHSFRWPPADLLERVETPQVVVLEGRVIWEPKVTAYRTSVPVRIERWESAAPGGALPGRGNMLLVDWTGPTPRYGDMVRVRGTLRPFAPPLNPGQWDRAAWHAQRGMYYQVESRYPRDSRVLPLPNRANPLVAGGFAARDWMASRLMLGLEDTPVTAGILQGLVLGVTDSSEPGIFDLFRETGTLHLFAVSGLHVGMVATFLGTGLGMLGLGRRALAAWLIPLLVAYAFVTGLQVPVVRSVVIAIIFSGALLLLRRPSLLNATGVAAFLLLAWDTRQLLQMGFQFSFCVVLTLVVLGEFMMRGFHHWGAPDPYLPRPLWRDWHLIRLRVCQWAVGLGVGGLAAWIGSLPLTLSYGGLLSWISWPANIVVIPLSFIVVVAGLLAILVSALPWVGVALATWLNQVSWLCIQGMMLFLQACWQVPGGYQYHNWPPRLAAPELAATVLALPGGGGAVAVESGGRQWLVDSGSSRSFLLAVEPALRQGGNLPTEAVILSHQDNGHIGGWREAQVYLRPRSLMAPPALDLPAPPVEEGAQTAPAPLPEPRRISRGDVLPLGEHASLEVLWPPPDRTGGIADNRCLVLRAVSPGGTILLMGDAGIATEQALLELATTDPEALRADVLIYHGHATDHYGWEPFLAAVQPRHIILAGEYGNEPLFRTRGAAVPGVEPVSMRIWTLRQTGALRVETAAGELGVRPLRPAREIGTESGG